MKILELRFKNLNSLYGEWVIDFTNPEYVVNGIFALTGSTGAGKSTLLDAICLALYGATPRLGKITKSGNEIMSRQTGECYAEVVFESQAGRFRCHWEQRRARKNSEGKLQEQEHQIADADSGNLVETKKSLVTRVIEKKTGMDFDRFTRSILLAQGGFDTFLKADVEQKSRILEQITGTEIYSEISRRVHERQRDEREKLNLLQAETAGIVILEPEQETEIEKNLKEKQQQETVLNVKTTTTCAAIAWHTTIAGLNQEINNLALEEVKLKKTIEAFKPQQDKLDQAIKAASLDGSYATLKALRKQQAEDQTALKSEVVIFPELESRANRQAELLEAAELWTVKVKVELSTAAPLIQKVRALDQMVAEQTKAIISTEESCHREETKIRADQRVRHKELKKRSAAEKNLERVDSYLKEYSQDEWLISGFAGVEEQLSNLQASQKEIARKKADGEQVESVRLQMIEKLDQCTQRCDTHKNELKIVVKKLHQGKAILSELLGQRLLREYRAEKEALLREMAYLRKIEEFENHRIKLEDGKPCPLCGACEHPFAQGNVPVADDTEKKIEALTQLITTAEELENVTHELTQAEAATRKKLTASEKLEATAITNKQAAERTVAELKAGLQQLQTGFNQLKQMVSVKLRPFGMTEIPETQVSSLLDDLKSRLNKWQGQIRAKTELEKQIAAIDSEIRRLEAVIETQGVGLAEKQQQLKSLRNELGATCAQRNNLYGNNNPDAEEKRLNKAVTDAEENERKARGLNLDLQQKLNRIQTDIEALKKRIDQREPELEIAQNHFCSELELAGFSDEKVFQEASLSPPERSLLAASAKQLDDDQKDLRSIQKDRKTRLESEIARNITDKSLDELTPQLTEYEDSLKELREIIAAIKYQLNENRAAKGRIREKRSAIDAQQKECQRWEKLHGLIGSADGKKYRNFAQGLTFELMVSHANRQLEKMTDRYLLIRDDEQPLELNVVDNYQAGEIRSTRNLSGGESFIVSLTLALGLSKMASRKVRVDSLFLDEGFGTLDEEALETSLETLSSLQQDGKLIGIISHVSALKERISTQITITPVSGGRSTLAGPGCSQVVN